MMESCASHLEPDQLGTTMKLSEDFHAGDRDTDAAATTLALHDKDDTKWRKQHGRTAAAQHSPPPAHLPLHCTAKQNELFNINTRRSLLPRQDELQLKLMSCVVSLSHHQHHHHTHFHLYTFRDTN